MIIGHNGQREANGRFAKGNSVQKDGNVIKEALKRRKENLLGFLAAVSDKVERTPTFFSDIIDDLIANKQYHLLLKTALYDITNIERAIKEDSTPEQFLHFDNPENFVKAEQILSNALAEIEKLQKENH